MPERHLVKRPLILRCALGATLALTGTVGLVALPGLAQDGGGVLLRFGLEQRFEATENESLSAVSAGTTTQATTRLSFGLTSDTGISQLSFNASGLLRAANRPGATGNSLDFDDPQLSFRYSRSSANARLNVGAFLRQSDLEFLRPLSDFTDPTGVIVLPPDLSDLTGTGTRRSTGVNAALIWGEDGPWGYGLTADINKLDYINTTDPELINNQRITLGSNLRFALSDATEATVSLKFSRFDDAAPASAARDTLSLALDLDHAMPAGSLTGSLTAERTEDGTRLGFRVGRTLELPRGSLSASLGVTRDTTSQTRLTANLAWQQELPRGQISASLQRSVAAGANDADTLVTALTVGYEQGLTPVSSINLNMTYADSTVTATDQSTRNASLSATYTHSLTEDWNLDLGYTHRLRDQTGAAAADSNSVFLVLKRNFEFSP